MADSASNPSARTSRDFIRQIIDRDLEEGGDRAGRVVTRFPPEPNGFLHIGHAKSIVLNFGLAEEYEGARCHLRFDDTNPSTEEVRYVEAIKEDVRWLGYDWQDRLHFASDYFDEMYGFAEVLVRKGLAYVDSQSEEAIREGRGTVTEPGRESPYRTRSIEDNLKLFRQMREGAFQSGEQVLRAKIDMASPNMLMRDPVLYRIRYVEHFRTGREWCVYPLYDFAHPLEDALEGVTYSLCTLEFTNNRELYDWVVEHTDVSHRPRQYEFARLNLDYTVMSKRRLLRLVEKGDVTGWDDPRMPTLAGLRRRGFTPQAIRNFCEMIGVARSDSRVDIGKLEYAIRDDLNQQAPRVLAVLNPLKVVLVDWPEDGDTTVEAPYFPRDVPLEGSRSLPFSRVLFIDREDFSDDPPPGFFRLVPDGEVRLRYGCVIRCREVVRDETGEITELRCTHDPKTWGGVSPEGRKVRGTVQWVAASHAVRCEVRLYDRLFTVEDPNAAASARGEDVDFREFLNPTSLEVITDALVEPSVLGDPPDTRYQFERLGYFQRDPVEGSDDRPVFNRIVTLRDTWAKAASGGTAKGRIPRSGERDERVRSGGDRVNVEVVDGPGVPPEVPAEVQARADALVKRFGLNEVDAEILARTPEVAGFFEATVAAYESTGPGGSGGSGQVESAGGLVANWVINDLPPVQGDRSLDQLPFGPDELAELVRLVEEGTLSSRGGRAVLETLSREGGRPAELVGRMNLKQVSDVDSLAPLVVEVLRADPEKVAAYRAGKTGLVGFFMGRLMHRSGGRADPELAKELLVRALNQGQ